MDTKNIKQQAEQVAQYILSLVQDGNASRVMLKRKDKTLFDLSLTTGVVGTIVGLSAAPCAVLTAVLVSFGMDCDVEIEKKDGTVIKLSETAFGAKMESFKAAVKDKVSGHFGTAADEDVPFEE